MIFVLLFAFFQKNQHIFLTSENPMLEYKSKVWYVSFAKGEKHGTVDQTTR